MPGRPTTTTVLRTHGTGDATIDRAIFQLEETLRRNAVPFSEGRQVDDVVITAGTTTRVQHGLGRAVRGWFVVRANAASQVFDQQADHEFPDRELWLDASGNVTVSLWVY